MRELLNHGWQFAKTGPGGTPEYWQEVTLPHDWMIGQEQDLYETGDGHYERRLTVPEEAAGDTWMLRFDGVYMDCDVSVNGRVVRTHRYGYTAFDADLTGRVRPGENVLRVLVRYRSPNTRWYSGAGIFRDVTLCHFSGAHLVTDGVYAAARPEAGGIWTLEVSAETAHAEGQTVSFELSRQGKPLARLEAPSGRDSARVCFRVAHPLRWSPEEPNLYTLTVRLGGDELRHRIGFRETVFDPDRGFLLNGEPLKLHGVCLHHDLGLLGSAFHEKAARRQLRVMKAMGVNALRTSHNPPASRLLDLCDEMGVLVVDEAFDMWRRPKTAYDYARFFDACAQEDVASWVRRDRNHPSVIMWSVGNEIYDCFADESAPALTAQLRDWVISHDPAGNARPTQGSNYMPWEGAQRCADELKLAGYNYGEKLYDKHHAEHPDWVIYGSETASSLASRGIYHFPLGTNILSEEDLQCSALGNSSTSWGGKSISQLLSADLNNPYSMGQFIWSGIDYIGEPTPYQTRCCYFGQTDTCCFPKDSYYRFQAAWTEAPMAHIGVPWDWNPGQLIDVPVMTNLAEAELFLNGVSLGRKPVDQRVEELALPVWQVPFQPGLLQARCYDADGHVRAQAVRCTPGEPARLVLSAEETALSADGRDLTFLTVHAVDDQGLPVENAANRVWVKVEGPARLIGLDNGDSSDADGYRQDSRFLFSGKLLAMVGFATRPGETRVTVTSPGLTPASLTLDCRISADVLPTAAPRIRPVPLTEKPLARRIELEALGDRALTPEHPSVDILARVLPEAAAGEEIRFRAVNSAGIEVPGAVMAPIPGGVRVTGTGDGAFWLRAGLTNGADHTRVLSHIELSASGFGSAALDPYGFITAGLYDLHEGDIGTGNERGISFARDGYSMAGFTHVDFGPVGSDEITLPIFALSGDRVELTLWDGDPREGGRAITTLSYQKPSIWNTYQPETWTLPERLTGVHTLCFSMEEKVHLQGFSFTRQSRAWLPLSPLEADEVYGDGFTRTDRGIEEIGNNVTLGFGNMDFGEGGDVLLRLRGVTPLDTCAVNVRVTDAQGREETHICAFRGTEEGTQPFRLHVPAGVCRVDFVFLPGAQFNFYGFQFSREG